jgi:hypothetical protein
VLLKPCRKQPLRTAVSAAFSHVPTPIRLKSFRHHSPGVLQISAFTSLYRAKGSVAVCTARQCSTLRPAVDVRWSNLHYPYKMRHGHDATVVTARHQFPIPRRTLEPRLSWTNVELNSLIGSPRRRICKAPCRYASYRHRLSSCCLTSWKYPLGTLQEARMNIQRKVDGRRTLDAKASGNLSKKARFRTFPLLLPFRLVLSYTTF